MSSPEPGLSRAELRRYSRQMLLPEFQVHQERLRVARVLVIGAGGLGCPVIACLAGAGVGELRIADSDAVSLSNLHRQTLYTQADLGRNKAEVAAARAQQVNPFVRVQALPDLTEEHASDHLAGTDLVIDATDNFAARYLIHDHCRAAQLPWVWGAASALEGMVSVFGPRWGLREVFPVPDDAGSCAEVGVAGPLTGVVGSVMAMEALKVLTGHPGALSGQLWTYDALSARVRVVRLRERSSAQT